MHLFAFLFLANYHDKWIGNLEIASPSKKSETPIFQMGTDPFPISGRGVLGPLIRLWEPEIPRLFVGATPLWLLPIHPAIHDGKPPESNFSGFWQKKVK